MTIFEALNGTLFPNESNEKGQKFVDTFINKLRDLENLFEILYILSLSSLDATERAENFYYEIAYITREAMEEANVITVDTATFDIFVSSVSILLINFL